MTRIALCFSGGGFRATLFHLGVLRRLSESGDLANVTIVTGVSGGSIIAAHLAVNWDTYLKGGDDFEQAAAELIAFAQRDVRGRIVRRWLLSPLLFPVFGSKAFHRISLLEREYSRFYQGHTLSSLGPTAESSTRPHFFLLATSMTTGGAFSFSSFGFERDDHVHKKQSLPLAMAVASSSAFPPLFPPVVLTRKLVDATPEEFPQQFECLSDGGIYDNLGVRWLLMRRAEQFDRIVLCDASAPLGWNVESRFGSLLTRTIRSTDILMRRVVDLEGGPHFKHDNSEKLSVDLVSIRLSGSGPKALHEELEARIPLVRTDLNAFSDEEADLLVQHGYAVADRVLAATADSIGATRLFLTASERAKLKHLHEVLKRARRNPLGLWNASDWASYILWGTILSPLLFILVFVVITSSTISEQEARNSALAAQLDEAQSKSSTYLARIEQQDATIRKLEEFAASVGQPASATEGPSSRQMLIAPGSHAHFVPSIPGAVEIEPRGEALICLQRGECTIEDFPGTKWGTIFTTIRPGAYSLVIKNRARSQLRVQFASHLPGQADLMPWQGSFTLEAGRTAQFVVVVR